MNLIAVQESQSGVCMYATAGTVRADTPGHQAGGALLARSQTACESGYRMDLETENFLIANTVQAREGHHGHSGPRGDGSDNLVAFDWQSGGDVRLNISEIPMLQANEVPAQSGHFGVRRLTPLECERLQGWPDDHTRWTADGREIPDSHRYRMIGNGVASPVAEWIGWRLAIVDRLLMNAYLKEHTV